MSGTKIRQKYMRQFVGMNKYKRSVAWLIIAWYLTQIAMGITAGHYLLGLESSAITVSLMVLISIFIGTRLRGMNNIVHECTHFSFSDHRQDNVTIGSLCSAVLTGCFHQYRDEHLSHHAHLGDYELDLDLKGIEDLRLHDPLTPATILRHATNPLWGRHLRQYSGVNFSGRDGMFFQGLKFLMLVVLFAYVFLEPLTTIFFVLIPLFYIFPTINYWTDCLDHAGVVGEEDELDASRNVLAPKILRPVFFPRNDCFHLVHHLFPQVPARHLETVHTELSHDPDYQSQELAVRPTHRAFASAIANTP